MRTFRASTPDWFLAVRTVLPEEMSAAQAHAAAGDAQDALTCLGWCLRDAGMSCAAFEQGVRFSDGITGGWSPKALWHPGCGITDAGTEPR